MGRHHLYEPGFIDNWILQSLAATIQSAIVLLQHRGLSLFCVLARLRVFPKAEGIQDSGASSISLSRAHCDFGLLPAGESESCSQGGNGDFLALTIVQNNLVHNQGFLDQVVFVPQTDDTVSLRWLEALVQQTPEYAISPTQQDMDWLFTRSDVLYIRIDGDTVFFEDHTIPTIVKTRLEDPDALMVSANVVSEGVLSSLHNHYGVALPYLPELDRTEDDSRSSAQDRMDWHASNLPQWNGPAEFIVQKGFSPPFQGHRWLLPAEEDSDRDPIAASIRLERGPGSQEWTVSAQHHYSFLDHLESDTLNRYKFPLWKNPPEAVTSTFGCFWGKDAAALRGVYAQNSGDELSRAWTASDGSHPKITIDGKGLVSHYSAELAPNGLDATDLLERYRAYALEKVCRQTW